MGAKKGEDETGAEEEEGGGTTTKEIIIKKKKNILCSLRSEQRQASKTISRELGLSSRTQHGRCARERNTKSRIATFIIIATSCTASQQ
jgi:hypothetical protein